MSPQKMVFFPFMAFLPRRRTPGGGIRRKEEPGGAQAETAASGAATAGRGAAQEGRHGLQHAVTAVFTGGLDVAGELAAYLDAQSVFPADIGKRPLDHRVQLLHTEDLVQPGEELDRSLLREREGGGDLEKPYLAKLRPCLLHVGVADCRRRRRPFSEREGTAPSASTLLRL